MKHSFYKVWMETHLEYFLKIERKYFRNLIRKYDIVVNIMVIFVIKQAQKIYILHKLQVCFTVIISTLPAVQFTNRVRQ